MALTERLALIIETVGTGKAVADFNRLGGAAKELAGQAKAGKFSLDGLARSAGVSAGVLKTGLATAAVAAGTGLLALANKGVDAFADLAEQIMKVQRVSGASAEDASRLVAVADDLGVSIDSVATGVFKLGRGVDALPALGVKIARDTSGAVNLTDTLINVADAYVATADPAKRAQLLTAAFGRSGKDLIPIVERGGQGIRDMYAAAEGKGLIMSQADLDTARTFSLVMDDLADTIQSGLVSVGRELIPILIDLGVVIDKVSTAARGMNDNFLGKGIKLFFQYGTGIGLAVKGLDFLAGAEGDARESAQKAEAAIREQDEALADLTKTTLASVSADRALSAATRDVDAANRAHADAVKDLNKLLAEGAVDEEKVADARRSLADATRSLQSATRNQAKAQREFDEAVAAAEALGGLDSALEEVADKHDRLLDANDAVTDATERETEAAENLAEAQRGDPEFQDKLADARQRVADTTQRVADAEYNLGQRSYEAAAAHEAEATAIDTKAAAVASLRGELETLFALNPQMQTFLAPLLAALQFDSSGGGDFGTTGGGLFGAFQQFLSTATPTTSTTTTSDTTTNQITINAPQDADPVHIARRMMWELN
jgi:hypothetical protein